MSDVINTGILDSMNPNDPNSVIYKGVLKGNVLEKKDETMHEINACIPFGKLGQNNDSLPKNSIINKNYELIFSANNTKDRYWGICQKKNSEIYVQKAFGTLTLYKINEDSSKVEIISVPAISGDGGNGCIPNKNYTSGKLIKYYVGNIIHSVQFHDGNIYQDKDKKWVAKDKSNAWKIIIYDNLINRGLFRIHPTPMYEGEPLSNDGCISPYPSENSVAFYKEIVNVLSKSNIVIPLYVDINNNYNISVQLKNYGKEE